MAKKTRGVRISDRERTRESVKERYKWRIEVPQAVFSAV